jgi:hypothetical protein
VGGLKNHELREEGVKRRQKVWFAAAIPRRGSEGPTCIGVDFGRPD